MKLKLLKRNKIRQISTIRTLPILMKDTSVKKSDIDKEKNKRHISSEKIFNNFMTIKQKGRK
jgi:hypothetical protein